MKIPKDNMWNIQSDCKYIVVFAPKYRLDVLVHPISVRLKELLGEMALEMNVELQSLSILPDHVKLIVKCDPRFGIHRAVKHWKAYTSKILRNEFQILRTRIPTLWSHSYYVATIGEISQDEINQYLETQRRN